MPESRAVLNVQRTAGDLDRQIRDLRRNVSGLVDDLARVDPRLSRTVQAIETYRQRIAQGTQLSGREQANLRNLTQYLRERTEGMGRVDKPALYGQLAAYAAQTAAEVGLRRAAPLGAAGPRAVAGGGGAVAPEAVRRELERVERELQQAEKDIDRAAQRAAPGDRERMRQAIAMVDPRLKGLTKRREALQAQLGGEGAAAGPPAEAAAGNLRRLGYTEEEIARARMIPGGPAIIGPAPYRPKPGTPAPPPILGPGRPAVPPEAVEPQRAAKETRRASEEATRAFSREEESVARLNMQKRLSGLTDRELQKEYKENFRNLRDQQKELDNLLNHYRRLRTYLDQNILGRRERITLEGLPERITDVRAGLRQFMLEREAISAEAQRRGLAPEGAALLGAGRRVGFRQLAGAALAGAGIGGGSFGGVLTGAILHSMRPSTALATLVGMAAIRATRPLRQAHTSRLAALQQMVPLGIATGIPPGVVARHVVPDLADALRIYLPEHYFRALGVLARTTGRTDDLPFVSDVAVLTGQTPEEAAAGIGQLRRIAPSYDPILSYRLYGGLRRAGFSRALYPQFQSAAQSLAAVGRSPLVFPPLAGVIGQIAAVAQLPIPGVQPGTPAAIQAAAELATGYNQTLRQPTGVFQDLAYLAVRRLRGTPAAERLRQSDVGIDINTVPGVLRAIRRAPQLAQAGLPEVARAIAAAQRGAFATPEAYELARMMGGTDFEVAHQMATRPLQLARALGAQAGPSMATPTEVAAAVQSREADAVYQRLVRPAAVELRGAAISAEVGQRWDTFTAAVKEVVITKMDEMIRAIVELLATTDVGEPAGRGSVARQLGPSAAPTPPPKRP